MIDTNVNPSNLAPGAPPRDPRITEILDRASRALRVIGDLDARLAAITPAAAELERIGDDGSDPIGYLSQIAIDVHGIDPDAVQEAIAKGGAIAMEERTRRTPPVAGLGPSSDDGWLPLEETTPPGGRPIIHLAGGKLPVIIDQAETALIGTSPEIYRYGGQLVRPVVEEVPAADETRTRVHRLAVVASPYLVEKFTSAAQWMKFDRRGNKWMDVDCPDKIAEVYLARSQWRMPPLVGIINAPMLRSDGSLLNTPGYDARTGILYRPDGVAFPRIPEHPTRDDALRELERLQGLISTFPFVAKADQSVALSAILSALDRRAVEATPMHTFSAPVAGTGKSKLVDICAMIAIGQRAPVLDQSKDDVEFDKRLVAALLRGGAIVSIDNVDRPLDSALLCQALTSAGMLQLRALGSSRDFDVPNMAMYFANGNNLTLAGDLTRRAVLCRLDPGCERPELREFDRDPVQIVKEARPAYVTAALTILRAYFVAPNKVNCSPIGSYENWSRRVREALLWLDCVDPCDTMMSARRADPVTVQLSNVIKSCIRSVGIDKSFSVQALVAMAKRLDPSGDHVHPDLREALLAVADDRNEINGRKLGKWIAKNEDRVIDGHKIMRRNIETGGVVHWVIAKVA
jgi:putative DNA primase/helicase